MNSQRKEKENTEINVSSFDGKMFESLETDSLIDSDEYEIEMDENISLEALLAELEEEDRKAEADYAASMARRASQSLPQEEVSTLSPVPTAVHEELKRLEAEKQELMDVFQRRQADFENYRRRIDRDRLESFNRVTCDVVRRLLPVIDNLQRALEAQTAIDLSDNPEFQNFAEGIGLVFDQLNNVLDALGVKIIPSVGEQFDPHVHEAVATELSEEYAPDTVTEELQRGYRLGDTLIRPAMVKVAAKP
jgi:molecular chaperone GrpE